jgi:hypothetical protein
VFVDIVQSVVALFFIIIINEYKSCAYLSQVELLEEDSRLVAENAEHPRFRKYSLIYYYFWSINKE